MIVGVTALSSSINWASVVLELAFLKPLDQRGAVGTGMDKSLASALSLLLDRRRPFANRREISVYAVSDRIGSHILIVPPEKIGGIVEPNLADECSPMAPDDSKNEAIGRHVAEFLIADMRAGGISKRLQPLQSGIGAVANSVLKALGEVPEIPPFEMYSEVLQDSVKSLIEAGDAHSPPQPR
jgi:propionyl-CoA:succinyl-CoA transferase